MQVLEAIGKNDPQALKAALAAGGDPNTIDKAGAPALLHAIDTGSMDLVRALVDAGAHLEGRDNIGWTALMAAAAADADALVAYLLRAGANPNHVGREDTPLTCAITDASLKVIQLLLDHGAEPDLRRPDGWTPLMLGAFRGDLNILGALLAQGADATVTLGLRLTDAATIAAANGHAQAATLLLEAADASHPAPSELWSAIKSWAEQKAPPLAARFVPADSEARMPESWGVLPTDAQLQLTKWARGLPFYDYLGLDLPGAITIWQELCDQAEGGENACAIGPNLQRCRARSFTQHHHRDTALRRRALEQLVETGTRVASNHDDRDLPTDRRRRGANLEHRCPIRLVEHCIVLHTNRAHVLDRVVLAT